MACPPELLSHYSVDPACCPRCAHHGCDAEIVWDEPWVGQQWLGSGCPGGASLPQVPALVPSSPSCCRSQISRLLALQSFGGKSFLESWSGFPFGKLVDINWFIAQLIHLSEEYRCFQCFFTSDVLECLCRTDVKLATLCGIYFLMRR